MGFAHVAGRWRTGLIRAEVKFWRLGMGVGKVLAK